MKKAISFEKNFSQVLVHQDLLLKETFKKVVLEKGEDGLAVTYIDEPEKLFASFDDLFMVAVTEQGCTFHTEEAQESMKRKRLFVVLALALISMVAITGCAVEAEYEVELVMNPEAAGTVTGSGLYKEGKWVTVEAEPREGYLFENWTLDGEEASGDKRYTIQVTSDKTLIAKIPELISWRGWKNWKRYAL